MKKLIFTLAVPALLFSCGGGDDYCGCVKELGDLKDPKEIAAKTTECSDMLKDKSDDEIKEMAKDCLSDLPGK